MAHLQPACGRRLHGTDPIEYRRRGPGTGGTHRTRTAGAGPRFSARDSPRRASASRPARAEGPGTRRGGRGRDHRRRASAGPSPHLRERGLREGDRLSRRRGPGAQLQVPSGGRRRIRPRLPRFARPSPASAMRRGDPELPPRRLRVLEPALHHAGLRRERRGHPLHRGPVGRQRAPAGRGGFASRQGGARARPAAGGESPAVAPAARGDARPGSLVARAFHPCTDLGGDAMGVVPLSRDRWGSTSPT